MPVNHYFQGGRGIGNEAEKRLHEDLIVEGLKIFGQDVYYLPRTLVNKDIVLGEDTSSRFDDSYLCEMYFETNEGFAGEKEIINKFGLEIRDDTTLVVAKRSWTNFVGSKANTIVSGRPNEGDIIYVPLMSAFFEILFVENQEPFYQLGNLPVYKLRCTRFEYSGEQMDTGFDVIDEKADNVSLNMIEYKFSLEQGNIAETGEGSIQLESSLSADTGQPTFLMQEDWVQPNIDQKSPYAQNLGLDAEAGIGTSSTLDDILDFTERNPFGEIDG